MRSYITKPSAMRKSGTATWNWRLVADAGRVVLVVDVVVDEIDEQFPV